MRFEKLNEYLRTFETTNDRIIPAETWIVARIDGRSFTRLTKETMAYDAPYDVRFRDAMMKTMEHLMSCGFSVRYGYAQSDEISLLFDLRSDAFERKTRKWLSILAGEASSAFTLQIGKVGVFDCRLSEFPNTRLVVDYFRWRAEDASRNCLNSHCYWMLRKLGESPNDATAKLSGLSKKAKHDLLFENSVNFNDLPEWQKRGFGICWEDFEKEGWNPILNEKVVANRRRLTHCLDLPVGKKYSEFIDDLCTTSSH